MQRRISGGGRLMLAICLGGTLLGSCALSNPGADEGIEPVTALYVHGTVGNDANPGTAEEPFSSIQAAIDRWVFLSDKPEIRVAAGTYGSDYRVTGEPVVLLEDGVALYGGYSDSDWSVRDPQLYPTIIRDASTSGGSAADPNQALAADTGVGQRTVVDGFVIRGGGGEISFAVFLVHASPQIRHCTIDGGEGASFSAGVYNLSSASPTIEGNSIDGGKGDVTFGIYNFTDCSPTIQGNRINGSGSGSQSLGIYNDAGCPAVIRNNLIDGGGGAYSLGIMSFESSPVLRNNTISGGRNGADWSVVLFNQSSRPAIQNNIMLTVGGAGRLGIYEYDADADPAALQNNDVYDCPNGLYYDADGNGSLLTAADLNDYSRTTQDSSSPSADNLSEDAVLIDIDGSDDDPATLGDNDWRLGAGSPGAVVAGGLNGAHSTASWGFTTDFDGAPRSPLEDGSTTGWSMGAYELDAAGAGVPGARAVISPPGSSAPTAVPAAAPPPPPIPLRSR